MKTLRTSSAQFILEFQNPISKIGYSLCLYVKNNGDSRVDSINSRCGRMYQHPYFCSRYFCSLFVHRRQIGSNTPKLNIILYKKTENRLFICSCSLKEFHNPRRNLSRPPQMVRRQLPPTFNNPRYDKLSTKSLVTPYSLSIPPPSNFVDADDFSHSLGKSRSRATAPGVVPWTPKTRRPEESSTGDFSNYTELRDNIDFEELLGEFGISSSSTTPRTTWAHRFSAPGFRRGVASDRS